MHSARGKQVKEKRNPLLDQVKHTGLTHFKPSSTIITNRHEGKTCTAGIHCDSNDDDNDNDDDEDIPTISGRLKAISDKYLKSSTHRFLAKFYKNPSSKLDEKSAEIEEPNTNENTNKINKVSNKYTRKIPTFYTGAWINLFGFRDFGFVLVFGFSEYRRLIKYLYLFTYLNKIF